MGQKCDFLGIVESVGHSNRIMMKNGAWKKRSNLIVVDDSGHSALLCIWGREDLEFQNVSLEDPTVIYIRNAKVSNFGNFSMNSNDESVIEINPT